MQILADVSPSDVFEPCPPDPKRVPCPPCPEDKNGFITKDELTGVLSSLGCSVTSEDVDTMLKEATTSRLGGRSRSSVEGA